MPQEMQATDAPSAREEYFRARRYARASYRVFDAMDRWLVRTPRHMRESDAYSTVKELKEKFRDEFKAAEENHNRQWRAYEEIGRKEAKRDG